MAEPIIRLAEGEVKGARVSGVLRFRGVPYAAGPVGDRRFRLPEAHPGWSGVRDATVAGANAPHVAKPFPGLDVAPLIGTGWTEGDDYLNADIWLPDDGRTGRPIMVFIHGGAFVLGSSTAAVQDGAAFARDGIVLVSITYRLGIEGFLPVDGAPANLGLLDQIAALKWVRANAEALGGDADNITVFGESAGAMSVACLVASPLAQGLFRRAIIQSGHGSMVRPLPVARRLTQKVARMLKVRPDADGFRGTRIKDTLRVLEAVIQPTVRLDLRDARGREPTYGLSKFLPVFGDDVLPEPPLDALGKGVGRDIDVLIGSNREEMNLYFVPTGVRAKLPGWLAPLILGRVERNARRILKTYRQQGEKPGWTFTRALSDLVFRYPARQFAAAHEGRTHVYEMEWQSPASGGELGACHGIELPFVFNTLASTTGPEGLTGEAPPQGLADRVHGLWVQYAKTGDLPWGEYSARDPQVYALEAGQAAVEPPMPCAAILN